MRQMTQAGLVAAALTIAGGIAPASAADLGGYPTRGSIKDSQPVAPARYEAPRGPAGPCYVRGDLGYSFSKNPSIKWPVANGGWAYDPSAVVARGGTYNAATNTVTPPAGGFPAGFDVNSGWFQTSTYAGEGVTNTSMDNAWFGGAGIGCGMGSRGIRGEVMLGYTGHRKIQGQPLTYTAAGLSPVVNTAIPALTEVVDPLHTGVSSHTLMFNGYKDFGNFNGIVPYVGAGVGMSYNRLSEVYFTDNPSLTNRIESESRLSLAWSLMAGIGWQVSDRAILDVGYRYMDYGKAQSGRVDSAGFVNPRVLVDDIRAHEFKLGLRYHLGGGEPQIAYQSMK